MSFCDSNEAMIYKELLAKADDLRATYQKVCTKKSWVEFQKAEITCAIYASINEVGIWKNEKF